MDEDADAQWHQGSVVEIVRAMDLCPSREFGIDSQTA